MSDQDLIRRGDAIAAVDAARHISPDEAIRELRAIPAVQVGLRPGEIERAVWSAMIWAADNNPGFNGVPEYTDGGNSFAETECRATAARIRSALTVQPSPDVAVALIYARACICSFTGGADGACAKTIARIDAALARLKGGAA